MATPNKSSNRPWGEKGGCKGEDEEPLDIPRRKDFLVLQLFHPGCRRNRHRDDNVVDVKRTFPSPPPRLLQRRTEDKVREQKAIPSSSPDSFARPRWYQHKAWTTPGGCFRSLSLAHHRTWEKVCCRVLLQWFPIPSPWAAEEDAEHSWRRLGLPIISHISSKSSSQTPSDTHQLGSVQAHIGAGGTGHLNNWLSWDKIQTHLICNSLKCSKNELLKEAGSPTTKENRVRPDSL